MSVAAALTRAVLLLSSSRGVRRQLLADLERTGAGQYLDAVVQGRCACDRPWPPPCRSCTCGPSSVPTLWPSAPLAFLASPPLERWLPFGAGIPRCPGAWLATMQTRAILPILLREARLRAAGPEEPAGLRGTVLAPRRGGRVESVHPAAL